MTNIPPYKIASILLHYIDKTLCFIGLPHDSSLEESVYILVVVSLALLLSWLLRIMILFIIRRIPSFKKSKSIIALHGENVIIKCSHMIPPIVFLALIPFAFSRGSHVLGIILKFSWIYLVIVTVLAINSIFNFIWHRYDELDNVHNHPLKGLLQVAKGAMWIIGCIIIISSLMHKSPVALLTGLGAFAAVLMLIFKDSILGLVSGVQLSQNDMLRVGDWIVVPNTPANGIVEEVSLTVVKVRNWDNTLAMLPPYTLVSTSFQNWRGMVEMGTRLINQNYNIATDSVVEATSDLLESLKKIGNQQLTDFITIKQSQAERNEVANTNNPANIVNGTIVTNLGLLRAYLTIYLKNHPLVSQKSFLMVSEQPPTPQGIPVQIYCYTATTDWASYESIKCEIFEHFTSMMPKFNIYPFEFPSGKDLNYWENNKT